MGSYYLKGIFRSKIRPSEALYRVKTSPNSGKVRVKMKEIRSKSSLGIALSRLEAFKDPKVSVEQYPTDSEIGAEVLWYASMKGDTGKVSADLGCGTGLLGIGMLLLGAEKVYFVDSESSALEIAKINLERVNSEYKVAGKAVFIEMDVKDFNEKVDTAIQNPPFGVKVRHADRIFIKKAFEIAKAVYSFHKTESKSFLERFSSRNNFLITNVWDFKFPLKSTYKFHSRRIKYIDVSCFRFEKEKLFK